jgi:hypothetical protein
MASSLAWGADSSHSAQAPVPIDWKINDGETFEQADDNNGCPPMNPSTSSLACSSTERDFTIFSLKPSRPATGCSRSQVCWRLTNTLTGIVFVPSSSTVSSNVGEVLLLGLLPK